MALSFEFAALLDKIKGKNQRHTSYWVKHVIERYFKSYICNGACIAGFHAAGFRIIQNPIRSSLNCRFNFREKSLMSALAAGPSD